MKKWIVCVLLAMGLAGLFSACGNDEEEQTQSAPVSSSEELSAAPEKSADAPAEESKATLVAVFSWANNADLPEDVDIVSSATLNKNASGALVGDTQLMGQTAAQVTGGDYFEILCETKYPGDEDKTYEQARQEQLDQARPQLASHVENMDAYGTIILVYPTGGAVCRCRWQASWRNTISPRKRSSLSAAMKQRTAALARAATRSPRCAMRMWRRATICAAMRRRLPAR